MKTRIETIISDSIAVKQRLLEDEALVGRLQEVAEACIACFKADGKLLFCGNGGSAADAQHLSAELSGRFYKDRAPLFAEALHVNTSFLTAVANDYSYDEVYARMVRAAGRPGDVLFAISTSGNSGNILRAVEAAKAQGMLVVGMTGESGGKMREACDYLLNVPSAITPRIQESHILMGHILCELIEEGVFGG
ncbi:MAG: D-sedoheptulose 7-phosphate isomerase [Haliscomenobacter sp.]|nr:D-sedoheptulose 7-phosphate isomerase [Haliscomenobacter sp.]MBK8656440.1 D-sedoheptulose 7-phosphate isomerase [Haliscomenobacter sp.]MBP9076511.1 D-sedoheptulose 7-phosphate isomerase [Haliscomenobacter sp.]MBP9873721.1 D-sedoheptulose 7-phosphate isomerase [Haliscomenobacter sp.]